MLVLGLAFSIGIATLSQASAPPIPEGLWLSRDEGFVVRVQACGEGFCGVEVGTPREQKEEKPEGTCGKTIMKDFKWSGKEKRWEGTMQRRRSIGATITTDGRTLTMTGHVMMMSKTMAFVPFTGTIGANCQIE